MAGDNGNDRSDDAVFLGIDIGGSGIKGAPVDVTGGELTAKRVRISTPDPSGPEQIADVVGQLAARFSGPSAHGPIGATFPGVVRDGHILTAANLDKSWIGIDADALFTRVTGRPVTLINDADAAGMAEMRFGAGRGRDGLVVMLTLGTGIGSAMFLRGELVANTELGHLEVNGVVGETRAAARVRDEEGLTWKQYAKRLDAYLARLEVVLWPDLIILGGGISAKADKWLPLLHTRTELVAAALANQAGIVGAALAVEHSGSPDRR